MSLRWKPFYGWWVFLSASTALMIGFALSAYALPVFYPELVGTFHWPRADVALGGSIKTLLVGLLAPLNGWIIDRKGAKAVLLAGVVTLAISLALLSGIASMWQYFLVCVFLGAGGSWTHHFPTQLLVANWFAKKRGLAIGILTASGGVGNILIPLISARLIKNYGWREALLILPILLIVPFVTVALLARNRPQDMGLLPDGDSEPAAAGPQLHPTGTHPSTKSMHSTHGGRDSSLDWSVFKTTAFWILLGVFFFSAWAQFSVWQHLVLFFRDEGFSPTVAASLLSLFLAGSTAGRFFSGPFADKFSADTAVLLSIALAGLAMVALVAAHTNAGIYLCVILFGMGEGGTVTSRPLLVFQHYGASGVGKLYGVATAMMTIGAFIGPVLSGHIHDRTGSYNLAVLLALILTGVSVLLVILLKRQKILAVSQP